MSASQTDTVELTLGAEQGNLPGLDFGVPPWARSILQATIDRAMEALSEVRCPGQLSLEAETQPILIEAEPQPQQLPLLPDPPLWEIPPAPRPRGRSPQPLGKNPQPLGKNPQPLGRSPQPLGRSPQPLGKNPQPPRKRGPRSRAGKLSEGQLALF